MPSVGDLQLVNAVLTSVGIGYRNQEYNIADWLFPRVRVAKEQGTYPIMGKEAMKEVDATRALRANIKDFEADVSTETYTCLEQALKARIDKREIQAAAGTTLAQLQRSRAMQIADELALIREVKAATLANTSGNYKAAHQVTPSTKWDAAGGKMIDDINDWAKLILLDIGRYPNTIVFGPDAWKAAETNAQALSLINVSDGPLQFAMLSNWFPYITRGGVATTTNHVSGSGATVFDDDGVVLAYVPPTPAAIGDPMEPGFGVTFVSQEYQASEWYEDGTKSFVVSASEIYVQKITGQDSSSDTGAGVYATATDT